MKKVVLSALLGIALCFGLSAAPDAPKAAAGTMSFASITSGLT